MPDNPGGHSPDAWANRPVIRAGGRRKAAKKRISVEMPTVVRKRKPKEPKRKKPW